MEHADAIDFLKTVDDKSIDCIVCDPPFGLDEHTFQKHYARKSDTVIQGYQPAPKDAKEYEEWADKWISQFPRILKETGSVYIVCAWNHVCDIELAIRKTPLTVLNHIIWKFNFGVYTQKKFTSSHYHILRCGFKNPAFYSRAYFNETQKTEDGHSAQYADMEDVWVIPKEYAQGSVKNINKLPDALIEKILKYSTKPGDTVADFFLGNFTTAYVARKLGRHIVGCEINKEAVDYHKPRVEAIPFGENAEEEKVSTKPKNAGKKLTKEDKDAIVKEYDTLHALLSKKECLVQLQTKFQRGHFSLINILKEHAR